MSDYQAPADVSQRCGCIMGIRVICTKHCGGHGIPGPFLVEHAGPVLREKGYAWHDNAATVLTSEDRTGQWRPTDAELERVFDPRECCTCGSGAHPRPCKRHKQAYRQHVDALNLAELSGSDGLDTLEACDRAERAIRELGERRVEAERERDDALAQASALLLQFGRHDRKCRLVDLMDGNGRDCTCGLDEAIASIERRRRKLEP